MGVPDFGMFVSGVTEKLPTGLDYTSLGNFLSAQSSDYDFRSNSSLHKFTFDLIRPARQWFSRSIPVGRPDKGVRAHLAEV
jgi:hypothetical protein